MALLTFTDVQLGFGGPLVLDGAQFVLQPGERVALVGRNGAGKSSLLRLIAGELTPDGGEIYVRKGVRIGFLSQQVPARIAGSVFDVVARGLGDEGRLLARYQQASRDLAQAPDDPARLDALTRAQAALDASDGWQVQHRVAYVLSQMELAPDALFAELSGGQRRRVMLAQAWVQEPDVLLLDEPTNHLDIATIEWMETLLRQFAGTLLFVTHDRAFLQALATRIVELDRGQLHSWECDYRTYLVRKEALLEAEAREQAAFDKKLAEEEAWLRKGIKARRTRNEGRVRALQEMREQRRERREQVDAASFGIQEGERTGKRVIEAKHVSYRYPGAEGPPIVDDLSTFIARGDTVGIVGPNGAGKTTLLRLLVGDFEPDSGSIRLGTNLQVAYFDQHRAQLDLEATAARNVAPFGDMVTVGGHAKHIISYLQDFLFTPDRARTAAKVLSGGERNRLLLAKLFVQPANVLVLDEPTNDLDLETLELLEHLLVSFNGTVLVVSHDRAFLNNVVTTILAVEGSGVIREYVGGYDDYLRQRPEPQEPAAIRAAPGEEEPAGKAAPSEDAASSAPKKLSYKLKRELDALPEAIEALEGEQRDLYERMAEPSFYQQPSEEITAAQDRLAEIEAALEQHYARWEELEALTP